MFLDPRDFMDRAFLLGIYEPALTRTIAKHVKPGEVCVDIGAHEGYAALHLARAVGASGLVIAVEPDPRAFSKLSSNLDHNHYSNVSLWQCALADTPGMVEFMLSRQLGFSTRFPSDKALKTIASTIQILSKTLDEILGEVGALGGARRISFIKIDAEGSEPLILKGMARTLVMHRPVIWIEVNRPSLGAAGRSATDIQDQLHQAGYVLYAIKPNGGDFPYRGFSLEKLAGLEIDVPERADFLAMPEGVGYSSL